MFAGSAEEAGQSELQMFLLTIERHQRGALTLNFKVWRGAFKNIKTPGMGYCGSLTLFFIYCLLVYHNSIS